MSYTHLSAKGCSHNPIVGILLCRLQSLLSVIANNRLLYQPQLKQRKSSVKSLCHSQILLITVQGLTNPLQMLCDSDSYWGDEPPRWLFYAVLPLSLCPCALWNLETMMIVVPSGLIPPITGCTPCFWHRVIIRTSDKQRALSGHRIRGKEGKWQELKCL